MSNLPTNRPCPTCGGQGYISERRQSPIDGRYVSGEITCPVCHGTGQAPSDPMTDLLHAIEAAEPKRMPDDVSENRQNTDITDSSPHQPASGDINVTKDKPQETNQVTEPEPSKCPECGSERVRSLYGKREWICLNVCEPPKLGECSRCEGTGFRYSTIAEGYTDEPCRHCGGTGIEPAPDSPDDELEQILKHVAYSPLPDGQTTYPEMVAEAHAKIMKLFKSWKCQK